MSGNTSSSENDSGRGRYWIIAFPFPISSSVSFIHFFAISYFPFPKVCESLASDPIQRPFRLIPVIYFLVHAITNLSINYCNPYVICVYLCLLASFRLNGIRHNHLNDSYMKFVKINDKSLSGSKTKQIEIIKSSYVV